MTLHYLGPNVEIFIKNIALKLSSCFVSYFSQIAISEEKNGEKIAKGSALISASWASLLRNHTCQSYMVLVTHTIMYITAIAPVLCLLLINFVC